MSTDETSVTEQLEAERDGLLADLQEYAKELRSKSDLYWAEILLDALGRLKAAPAPTNAAQRKARAKWHRAIDKGMEDAKAGRRPDFARIRELNAVYYSEISK